MQSSTLATAPRQTPRPTNFGLSEHGPAAETRIEIPGDDPQDRLAASSQTRWPKGRSATRQIESCRGWARVAGLLPPETCERAARGCAITAGGLGGCLLGVGVGAVGGIVVGALVGVVVVVMVGGTGEWGEAVIDTCTRFTARTLGIVFGLLGGFIGTMATWEAITERI